MTKSVLNGLPGSGQAGQLPAPRWDPLLRIAHWGIALVVISNYALNKAGGSVHIALGWAAIGLLALRLLWGFVGPREARFSTFPPQPMAALRHLFGLLRGVAPHYPSHNPAGAMMAYALWACLAVMIGTGLGMTTTSPMKQAEQEAAVAAGDWSALVTEGRDGAHEDSVLGEAVKEVHEVTANLIILLAMLHVAGVFVEGRVMGRNLVRPMLIARRNRE